VIIKDRITSR